METIITWDFIFRWGHVLFGITWIGMLYYFNFVQGAYFKDASPEGLQDAKAKLAPRALWWFRWGAAFTFITGILLWAKLGSGFNNMIVLGSVLGALMFLNVWLVIWPNQKVALGLKEGGDAGKAAAKALLASRTNTLFSAPMLLGMLGSKHLVGAGTYAMGVSEYSAAGLGIALVIVLLLELNALFGKMGPMASVKGVIHCSIALAVLFLLLLQLV